MLPAVLQNIGLTENEATIYELLVKLGEVPVSLLISESRLKRPTVYKTLYSLKQKHLVTLRDIKKKIHAKPESPEKILNILKDKYSVLDQTKENVNMFIPELINLYVYSTQKPVVRTYEGINGLKEIYNDLLHGKKPIYAILQAAEVEPELYKWLTTVFVKKRVKEKIHVKAIIAESKKSREYKEKDIKEYRISVLVQNDLFPFQHEIDIYGDKVAFVHYKKDEPLIGVVIDHPQIAKTMKAFFDLAWAGVAR